VIAAAMLLLESRADGGARDTAGPEAMRPLPVWSPLPRLALHPKVTVAGWLAGRTAQPIPAVRTTSSYAFIRVDAPTSIRSNPRHAIRLGGRGCRAGELYAIGDLKNAVQTVPGALAAEARFSDSLDLRSLNDRRARAGVDASHAELPGQPTHGRLCLSIGFDPPGVPLEIREIAGDETLFAWVGSADPDPPPADAWLTVLEHAVAHLRLLDAAEAASRYLRRRERQAERMAAVESAWTLGEGISSELLTRIGAASAFAAMSERWSAAVARLATTR
jgi:hypothetical protein